MQFIVKSAKWVLLVLLVVAAGGALWLYVAPPALIRVGAAYSAKIVCSNVFLAGRDPGEVLAIDVQAPGHPLLRLMRVSVDRDAGSVSAGLLGLFGTMTAVHRQGVGCTSAPDGVASLPPVAVPPVRPLADRTASWPVGDAVEIAAGSPVQAVVEDDALAGPGMRAIVVVQDGRIVAERYAEGFGPQTPLLGWSMTKTVTAALIGGLVRDGRMRLDEAGLFPQWSDDRSDITIADLMVMSSGLAFNEDYGDVTDVTRMLYLEADMAGFAAAQPLVAPPGTQFSYSSGTTTILSRIWQRVFPRPEDALAWPGLSLFGRIGMTSATLEVDAAGTYVGSSYLYATARDWVRFAQLLMDRGRWEGSIVLEEAFVDMMLTPGPASEAYGRGQVWLSGPRGNDGFAIPADDFWLRGHDGQTITVIPSRRLIVLRMGLTPSKLGYRPQGLVEGVLQALPQ